MAADPIGLVDDQMRYGIAQEHPAQRRSPPAGIVIVFGEEEEHDPRRGRQPLGDAQQIVAIDPKTVQVTAKVAAAGPIADALVAGMVQAPR